MSEVEERIEVRRATLADVSFIRRLALASVVYGIPDGRDVSNAVVVERARGALENLELMVHRRREVAMLVAVDRARDDHRVGYLILEYNHVEESTGDRQSYIYDMAVEPEYQGRFVPHRLVREAARVSHQQGYRFMSATVSASNRKALLTALKMGFEVERYGLIMACGEDGIERMPGRPEHERAHDFQRLMQRRRRRRDITPEEQETNP